MTANGVSLDNVEYGTAVAVLRECGESVTLSLRRRLVLPSNTPHTLRIHLNKTRKKDGNYSDYYRHLTYTYIHTTILG